MSIGKMVKKSVKFISVFGNFSMHFPLTKIRNNGEGAVKLENVIHNPSTEAPFTTQVR